MSAPVRSWYLSCSIRGDRVNLKTRKVEVDRGVVRKKLNINRRDDGSLTIRVFDANKRNRSWLATVDVPAPAGDELLNALLARTLRTIRSSTNGSRRPPERSSHERDDGAGDMLAPSLFGRIREVRTVGHETVVAKGSAVYANVITWRLAPGEDLHQFVRDVTAQTGDWPPPGMLDGYVVQVGPERAVTVGFYETQADADAVAERLRAGVGALGHRAELVERQAGEAHDVWGPDPSWD